MRGEQTVDDSGPGLRQKGRFMEDDDDDNDGGEGEARSEAIHDERRRSQGASL